MFSVPFLFKISLKFFLFFLIFSTFGILGNSGLISSWLWRFFRYLSFTVIAHRVCSSTLPSRIDMTSRQLIFWEFSTHNSVIPATTFIKNDPNFAPPLLFQAPRLLKSRNKVAQLPTTPLFQPPHFQPKQFRTIPHSKDYFFRMQSHAFKFHFHFCVKIENVL